jgi:hypothetical protein
MGMIIMHKHLSILKFLKKIIIIKSKINKKMRRMKMKKKITHKIIEKIYLKRC